MFVLEPINVGTQGDKDRLTSSSPSRLKPRAECGVGLTQPTWLTNLRPGGAEKTGWESERRGHSLPPHSLVPRSPVCRAGAVQPCDFPVNLADAFRLPSRSRPTPLGRGPPIQPTPAFLSSLSFSLPTHDSNSTGFVQRGQALSHHWP